ncbi:hypothetical protein [Halosimplex sp. TS25]|uniref:hypothetical protein n=1 Tax=Halosimplex rarum TaxID=3396619 RepID=UPI0039E910C4
MSAISGGPASTARRFVRDVRRRAFVVELAAAVALLALAQAYLNLLDVVFHPVLALASSLPAGQRWTLARVVYGVLAIGGLGALAAAYVTVREVDLSLSLPEREHGPLVAIAALVPAVLAVGSNVAAVVAAPEFSVGDFAVAALNGPFGYLPGDYLVDPLVLVTLTALLYHGLVQASLARVVDGDIAVLATTLVAGILLREPHSMQFRNGPLWFTFSTEGVSMAVLFVITIAVIAHATDQFEDSRLRWLAFVPAVLALAYVAMWTTTTASSALDHVHTASGVVVIATAAYAYDRTDSLLVPAVAYLSFAVVDELLMSARTAVFVSQFA